MSERDGGPVHPMRGGGHAACLPGEECRVSDGISLRDYFAAAALPGLMTAWGLTPSVVANGKFHCEAVAGAVYAIADAMIAAREKP